MSSFDPSGQNAEHSATRRSKLWESLSFTFTSLDGVIQSPGMPEEDREGGFDKGGWQVPYFDQESGQVMGEAMAAFDALLLGRKTYEIFASFWPHAPADDPIAARLNQAPKYVASLTFDTVEWNNSTLLNGDIADEVARMKETYNEVHTYGSGNLVQSLMRHELVDQYNLWVYPLLLGTGKRLFGEGTVPTALRLVGSRTFSNGALLLSMNRRASRSTAQRRPRPDRRNR